MVETLSIDRRGRAHRTLTHKGRYGTLKNMSNEITTTVENAVQIGRVSFALPRIITDASEHAGKRFIELFTATIRNKNTREAYGRAVRDFFAWCDANEQQDRHIYIKVVTIPFTHVNLPP